MREFKKEEFYQWIKDQPDDRELNMGSPSIGPHCCLMGSFFYDQKVKETMIGYCEEEDGTYSNGAKIIDWSEDDFLFIKKLIDSNMNYKKVKRILNKEKGQKL